MILGWKGPKYKKFNTYAEAEAFVRAYANSNAATLGGDPDSDDEEPPVKKAKVLAKLGSSNLPVLKVYTDGSSRGNGTVVAAAGVGVYFGPDDPRFAMSL